VGTVESGGMNGGRHPAGRRQADRRDTYWPMPHTLPNRGIISAINKMEGFN